MSTFLESMNVFLQSLFDVKIGLVPKMFFFLNSIWVLYSIHGNELKKKKIFQLKNAQKKEFFFWSGQRGLENIKLKVG